jgi:hypothetical protein
MKSTLVEVESNWVTGEKMEALLRELQRRKNQCEEDDGCILGIGKMRKKKQRCEFYFMETKVKTTPTIKLGFLWPLIIVFETRHVVLLFVWFWKENGRKENKVEEK